MTRHPTPEEIAEERRRLRKLRTLVDLTQGVLYQQAGLELSEAMQLINKTREAILLLFPGQERTYDLLYRPRFNRILSERYRVPPEAMPRLTADGAPEPSA